ncbi:hypothetical protein FKP32DRAFT_1643340 [Trametes sanguinea]|nr:hypothetical protein FKP32DRAFT_1643340 [Trametes sanguinea]
MCSTSRRDAARKPVRVSAHHRVTWHLWKSICLRTTAHSECGETCFYLTFLVLLVFFGCRWHCFNGLRSHHPGYALADDVLVHNSLDPD